MKKAYGYFAGGRFGSKDGSLVTDEIALNPSHFSVRTTEQSLSTLVHEMVHLWQHHFGNPSRGGYHNREWAEKMNSVRLIPSSTGETGQRVTHYIAGGGAFQTVYAKLERDGFDALYIELWNDAKKQAPSKTCYTCPSCGLNAWAKPNVRLMCAECVLVLESPPTEYATSTPHRFFGCSDLRLIYGPSNELTPARGNVRIRPCGQVIHHAGSRV